MQTLHNCLIRHAGILAALWVFGFLPTVVVGEPTSIDGVEIWRADGANAPLSSAKFHAWIAGSAVSSFDDKYSKGYEVPGVRIGRPYISSDGSIIVAGAPPSSTMQYTYFVRSNPRLAITKTFTPVSFDLLGINAIHATITFLAPKYTKSDPNWNKDILLVTEWVYYTGNSNLGVVFSPAIYARESSLVADKLVCSTWATGSGSGFDDGFPALFFSNPLSLSSFVDTDGADLGMLNMAGNDSVKFYSSEEELDTTTLALGSATSISATNQSDSQGGFIRLTFGQAIGATFTDFQSTGASNPGDSVPDVFTFTDVSDAEFGTAYTSTEITVRGIIGIAPISVVGGDYNINGSAFTNVSGSVQNGDRISVRLVSSSAAIVKTTGTLTIGGVSDGYDVTTKAVGIGGLVVGWGDMGTAQIPSGLSNVVTIASGPFSGLAVILNGTVDAWGNNQYGQLAIPVGTGNVLEVAGGAYASMALKSDGTVTAWGLSGFAQSYVPAGLSNVVGIAYQGATSLALRSDGSVSAWDSGADLYNSLAADVNGLVNVVKITGGYQHYLALNSDGTVMAWGNNDYNNPVPAGLGNVVAIAAGYDFSMALKTDGTVVVWGDTHNIWGVNNIPNGLSNVIAISAGWGHCLALKSDGTVVAWGYNTSGQTNVLAGLSNVVAIAANGDHSLALKSGTLNRRILVIGNMSFGAVKQGAVATRTLSIVNAGTSVLSIDGIQLPAGLTGNWSGAIPPGHYQNVSVSFSPTSAGNYSGAIKVISDKTRGVDEIVMTGNCPTPADTTPNNFSFDDVTDAELRTVNTASITVSGINAAASISIIGGEYKINSGSYRTTTGTVTNGATVTVRQISAESYSTKTSARLTIGGISDDYDVTTKAAVATDSVPDQFYFIDVTGADLSVVYPSNSITVTGIDAATAISISGGEYKIDGGSYMTTTGTVANNTTVTVRQVSSASNSTKTSARLTIGGVSDDFDVTTKASGVPGAASDEFSETVSIILTDNQAQLASVNNTATKEIGEPDHAGNSGGHSVWWQWTAPANGTVNLDTIGSTFDTVLAVYTGTSVASLTAIAADDDNGGNNTSALSFPAVDGTTYYFAVDGYGGQIGSIALNLAFAPAENDNDQFSDAITLEGDSGTVTGSNIDASKESGEPRHGDVNGGASVWYYFTPTRTGTLALEFTYSGDGVVLPAIAVYVGSTVDQLTIVSSNGYGGGWMNGSAVAPFTAEAGVRYAIAVDEVFGKPIDFTLDWALVFPPTDVSATKGAFTERVAISWAASANATGYDIYRSTSDDSDYATQINGTALNTTSYDDMMAEPGVLYYYWVRAKVGGADSDFSTADSGYLAAPSNDTFAGAAAFSANGELATGSLSGAGLETGEITSNYWNEGSVWWEWTAPASGQFTVSIPNEYSGADVRIFTGSSLSTLTFVGGNEGWRNIFALNVNAGVSYYIRVAESRGSSIAFSATFLAAPANDSFVSALLLEGTNATASGSSLLATSEQGEPEAEHYNTLESMQGRNSVWWKWVAPENGLVTVSQPSSGFDFRVGVFQGDVLPSLVTVWSWLASGQQFYAIKGQVYHLAAYSRDSGDGGSITFSLSQQGAPINDRFEDATLVPGNTAHVTGTTIGAWHDEGQSLDLDRTVWWKWTAPSVGRIRISSSTVPMAIYRGTSVDSLVSLGNLNGYSTFTGDSGEIPVAAGQAYYLAASSYQYEEADLSFDFNFQAAPANDQYDDAVTVSGSSYTQQLDLSGATVESQGVEEIVAKSAWWRWVAPHDGWLELDTLASTAATRISVYTGSVIQELELIARDDQFSDSQTWLRLFVHAGVTYSIVVGIDSNVDYGTGATAVTDSVINLNLQSFSSPVNDTAIGASVLVGDNPSGTGNFEGAIPGADEDNLFGEGLRGHTVWWRWTASQSGNLLVDVTGGNAVLSGVYTKNNEGELVREQVYLTSGPTIPVTVSQTYYLALDQWADGAPADNDYAISLSFTSAPGNDFFAKAFELAGSDTSISVYDLSSTIEGGESHNFDSYDDNGLIGSTWWRFTPPADGTIRFSNFSSPGWPWVFRIHMAVKTEVRPGISDTWLVSPGYGTDSNGQFLQLEVDSNHTYYFAVARYAGASGNFSAKFTYATAPVAPHVTTHPLSQTVVVGSGPSFIVAVDGWPIPILQWQISMDGGSTWNNITDEGIYTGATTGALTIASTNFVMNDYRYRALASNSVQSNVASNAAILTVQSDFISWRALRFTGAEISDPTISGPGSDPDTDGLANLIEYALGLEPKAVSTSDLPELSTTATDWVYTYTRPSDRSDVTYTVEVSTNLTTWTSAGVTHELVSTTAGIDTWRARYPLASGANVFFRLMVVH